MLLTVRKIERKSHGIICKGLIECVDVQLEEAKTVIRYALFTRKGQYNGIKPVRLTLDDAI